MYFCITIILQLKDKIYLLKCNRFKGKKLKYIKICEKEFAYEEILPIIHEKIIDAFAPFKKETCLYHFFVSYDDFNT